MSLLDKGTPATAGAATVAEVGAAGVGRTRSPRGDVWRRFRRNRLAMVGLGILGILVLVAVFAPLIAPFGITERTSEFRSPPSRDHLFGTDRIGRDVFSRVVFGARVSLRVGILATIISLVVGILAGAVAGFFGGLADTAIMRVTDMFLAIPYVVLAVAIATVFGRSVNSIILVLGFTGWLSICRIVRSSFLSAKQLDFVQAATAIGSSRARVMFRHILPNALQPIIVYGTIAVGTAILNEAALSFIGVGPVAPTPAWGLMVAEGKGDLANSPHLLFFPGAAIFVTVLAFVFIGDGLRDSLDAKLR